VDLAVARLTNEETKPLPGWALVGEGDVLVNSTGTGTVGRVGWLRKGTSIRVTADSHVSIIRPKQDRVVPEYLAYYLHARETQLAALAEGSTNQVELSAVSLKDLEIWLPPRPEQERIADLMSSVDSAIRGAIDRMRSGTVLKESLLAALLTGEHVLPASYDDVLIHNES
jgi:type I restriction enzyme S subunit